MITRCSLLITILISFLPSHKGCFPTNAEDDFVASTTTPAVTKTDEATTAEPTTTVTSTTSTTSTTTTTTTTTTLPPCPALNSQVSRTVNPPTPGTFRTDFSPMNFELNTYPVGTTLSIQCYVTPLGIGAGFMGVSVAMIDDSGPIFWQDINNGPAPGGESFTLTCLPSGSYEAVIISTASSAAQSVSITVGGSGFILCGGCTITLPPICLSPSG